MAQGTYRDGVRYSRWNNSWPVYRFVRVSNFSNSWELAGPTWADFPYFGSDDCLVIVGTKDSIDNKERLIPFIKDKFINHIDKTNKIIYVDWQKDF